MRTPLVVLAVGCLLGCAGWIAAGRLDRPRSPDPAATTPPQPARLVSISDAVSMPIFSVPAGQPVAAPSLQTPPPTSSLRLLGVSMTPRRRAAFLSIGGPPFWLSVGQSKEGVTLSRLGRDSVEVQVGGTTHRLALFKAPAGPHLPAPAAPGESARTGPSPTTPPKGPEPASAPQTPP